MKDIKFTTGDGIVYTAFHHPGNHDITIVTWYDEYSGPLEMGFRLYSTEKVIRNFADGRWNEL